MQHYCHLSLAGHRHHLESLLIYRLQRIVLHRRRGERVRERGNRLVRMCRGRLMNREFLF